MTINGFNSRSSYVVNFNAVTIIYIMLSHFAFQRMGFGIGKID